MALTDKQERFCHEYMIDLNATQAAIRAGYAEPRASEQAYQLLQKTTVQNRIAELQKEIADRNNITIDECVSILAKLARFDIADLYDEDNNLKPIHEIEKDARLSLEGMDVEEHRIDGMLVSTTKKVKVGSRRQALDMLLKHLGGYEKDNSQKTFPLALDVVIHKPKDDD